MLDVGCWMLDVGCWMLDYKKMAKLILKRSEFQSFRFGADCAKCLADSVHRYAESQTFVQGAPKLELLLISISNTPFV